MDQYRRETHADQTYSLTNKGEPSFVRDLVEARLKLQT